VAGIDTAVIEKWPGKPSIVIFSLRTTNMYVYSPPGSIVKIYYMSDRETVNKNKTTKCQLLKTSLLKSCTIC